MCAPFSEMNIALAFRMNPGVQIRNEYKPLYGYHWQWLFYNHKVKPYCVDRVHTCTDQVSFKPRSRKKGENNANKNAYFAWTEGINCHVLFYTKWVSSFRLSGVYAFLFPWTRLKLTWLARRQRPWKCRCKCKTKSQRYNKLLCHDAKVRNEDTIRLILLQ